MTNLIVSDYKSTLNAVLALPIENQVDLIDEIANNAPTVVTQEDRNKLHDAARRIRIALAGIQS